VSLSVLGDRTRGTNIAQLRRIVELLRQSEAMNADHLPQWLSQTVFVAVFLVAAASHPMRTNVNAALFGAAALIIARREVPHARRAL